MLYEVDKLKRTFVEVEVGFFILLIYFLEIKG